MYYSYLTLNKFALSKTFKNSTVFLYNVDLISNITNRNSLQNIRSSQRPGIVFFDKQCMSATEYYS